MSRHSKWAKIKRQKTATDVKRSQLFSKLSRAISVAARDGGGDPDTNQQLHLAIDRAVAADMPKDNVARAIARAAGSGTDGTAAALTLEGYGPGGAALLIEAVTDNRNRTVSDVRRLLSDAGGSLGSSGSVAWQFARRGLLTVEQAPNPDEVELAAMDQGALDVGREGSNLDILTAPGQLKATETALTAKGITLATVQMTNTPKQFITLDHGTTEKLARLIEELEEHDDVVEVTTNAAPPEGTEHKSVVA